jgi:hypothetical protein
VTWYANGRLIRRVQATRGQRRFTATLPATVATQRIVARVVFTSASTVSSRVLRATVRRCAPASVRPRFTG